MKTVEYFGYELDVPDNATHLAADSDGTVYAFCGKPVRGENVWRPEGGFLNLAKCFLTNCPRLDMESVDWRDSLQEIEE